MLTLSTIPDVIALYSTRTTMKTVTSGRRTAYLYQVSICPPLLRPGLHTLPHHPFRSRGAICPLWCPIYQSRKLSKHCASPYARDAARSSWLTFSSSFVLHSSICILVRSSFMLTHLCTITDIFPNSPPYFVLIFVLRPSPLRAWSRWLSQKFSHLAHFLRVKCFSESINHILCLESPMVSPVIVRHQVALDSQCPSTRPVSAPMSSKRVLIAPHLS